MANVVYKSMYKNELARAAGVSGKTFCRWIHTDLEVLSAFGVSLRTQILPPAAVKYLCEKYVIALD